MTFRAVINIKLEIDWISNKTAIENALLQFVIYLKMAVAHL